MRDQHRSKQDLLNEVTDLRKQVADLRQAALERRRVEDGLRHEHGLLRALLDQAHHPLCLLDSNASPLLANRAFVELLGYRSPGELVRLGGELGIFLADARGTGGQASGLAGEITFRRSDGAGVSAPVISTVVPHTEYLAITVVTPRHPA